ncbi:MAG: cation diffusion facilitator family transporter [bacterium]
MSLSLAMGLILLVVKVGAYILTGSPAILSDALESIIHIAAVGFAAWSLALSRRPPDRNHTYGHEKVAFFSAGAEGALIVVAAILIVLSAIGKWRAGLSSEALGAGTALIAGAGLANGVLGVWLIREGKKTRSLIVESNGRHVLTDCWTSVGVVAGLLLTLATGWLPFDPIAAILVALNICWSGWRLMRRSIGGLMDEGSPATERAVLDALEAAARPLGVTWHGVRHRSAGQSVWVELHLLFPRGTPIEEAHAKASAIERAIESALANDAHVITHLESAEDHTDDHDAPHFFPVMSRASR